VAHPVVKLGLSALFMHPLIVVGWLKLSFYRWLNLGCLVFSCLVVSEALQTGHFIQGALLSFAGGWQLLQLVAYKNIGYAWYELVDSTLKLSLQITGVYQPAFDEPLYPLLG